MIWVWAGWMILALLTLGGFGYLAACLIDRVGNRYRQGDE